MTASSCVGIERLLAESHSPEALLSIQHELGVLLREAPQDSCLARVSANRLEVERNRLEIPLLSVQGIALGDEARSTPAHRGLRHSGEQAQNGLHDWLRFDRGSLSGGCERPGFGGPGKNSLVVPW